MTTETNAKDMSDGPKSGGRSLSADEDNPHIILERCGFRCQLCGKIGHPHELEEELLLVHPQIGRAHV